MDRELFLKERMTGIGGSDAAAALGLSPWRQPLELYMEKRGEIPPSDETEPMRWGTLLEPVIRQEYANRTGREVIQPPMLRHAKHAFMIVHVDGITKDDRIFEAKTARSSEGWGEPGTDAVPMAYTLQLQHSMLVAELHVSDLAVLIGGNDFRLYEIPADRELQEMMVEGEAVFWNHVQQGKPPEPDYEAPSTLGLIRRLYPGTDGTRMVATEEQERWRKVMEEAQAKADALQAVADGSRSRLLWDMQESALLAFADGKALRRRQVNRKAYSVEATSYVEARVVADK